MALTGYEKAAIFLNAVSEDVASQILKQLDQNDISKISSYMTKKRKNQRDDMDNVCKEAMEKISSGDISVGGGGGEEYVKKILARGLGNEDAERIMEMVAKESPLDILKWVDSSTLSNFLVNEHPQTIALILCLLEPEQAAEVMELLPEDIRWDVSVRVAETQRIPEGALVEIEEVLKVQLDIKNTSEGKKFEGTKVIADILNCCDRSTESQILEKVETENADLADAIRELMLVFEDLEQIDDRGIQMILKEVTTEDLSIALKSASDNIKDKIFNNMSQRAVKILKEDMEAQGPVKLSDVEAAQQNIVRVAKKLDDEGKIIIAGRGGEEMVV
jgi:flagellar motor switch protein FliG